MNRGELLTSALRVIQNPNEFRAASNEWLDDGLREIEKKGDWSFLQKETTHVLETAIDEVAFSATKFPAAAITDFSKEMKVFRPGYGNLLEIDSREEFNQARGLGLTEIPTHFFTGNGVGGESIFFFPTWISTLTSTTLTLSWCGQIIVPTVDSDDLLTVSGLKPKLQELLIRYVRHKLWEQTDEDRQASELVDFEKGLNEAFVEDLTGAAIAGIGG